MRPFQRTRLQADHADLLLGGIAVWAVALIVIGFLDLLHLDFLLTILILGLVAYSFTQSANSLLCALMVLVPNDSMLAIGGFISLSSAVVVVCLLKVLANGGSKVEIDGVVIVAGFTMITAALIRYLGSGEAYVTGTIKITLSFILVAVYANRIGGGRDTALLEGVSVAFVVGCCVLLTLSFANYYAFDLDYNRMRPVSGDPNYMSLYYSVVIGLLLVRVFTGADRGGKAILDCALMILFVAGGLLSQSRGFIVMMVPVAVYLVVKMLKTMGNRPFLGFGLLILAASAATVLSIQPDNVVDRIVGRLTSVETAGGSGRTLIWEAYIRNFFSSIGFFLFGVPQAALGDLGVHIGVGRTVAVHNLYIETLCQQGFVFSIGFVLAVVGIRQQIPHLRVPGSCLPLISLCAGYFFLSGALSVTLPFILFVVFLTPLILNARLKAFKNERT